MTEPRAVVLGPDGIALPPSSKALSAIGSRGGWVPLITEPFGGAWQQNVKVDQNAVLAFSAVYSCISLISSDIGKLRIRLMAKDDTGVWTEVENAAYSPVLRKPNRYQTRVKFFENWVISKLVNGNTYVLKSRDARGVVTALYILEPARVNPLVSDDGAVFYQLSRDNLSGLQEDTVVVPASEIIHDTMVALYHPLVGVSPIHASGLAATQGLRMQQNSTKFFQNGAQPSGILTAPGRILPETAERLKAQWEKNFGGENVGRTAVLGDGLHYEPTAVKATDAQYIEQLKWTAETVCSAFHVPLYMIGVGPPPTYNNIEALNQQYYSQCLQSHIESIELLLDEGLELKAKHGASFDLDDLLRMDTATKTKAAADAVGAGFMAPDEARAKFDLRPVKGGATPYLQQQNYSLAALDERDRNGPFDEPSSPPAPAEPAPDVVPTVEDGARIAAELYHRSAKFDARDAA